MRENAKLKRGISMKHKKGFVLCVVCVSAFLALLWYNSMQVPISRPISSNQMVAIDEAGSIREVGAETRRVSDFQLSLEAALEAIDGVSFANVTCGKEDETTYRVAVLGRIAEIEDDVLSYLEQLDGYLISDQTSYDDQMVFELTRY